MSDKRIIKIEGYIIVAEYHDKDRYLSDNKHWVHSVKELKLSDIRAFPVNNFDMSKWPLMKQGYRNAQITITIDL